MRTFAIPFDERVFIDNIERDNEVKKLEIKSL